MLFNTNKKLRLFFQWKLIVVSIFVFSIFLQQQVLAISTPETVYNGEYFTPVCASGATFFDVPGVYPPQNCGTEIRFTDVQERTYEVRDLDNNGNHIPPSSYVTSIYDNVGCTDPIAENYDPGAIYDDGFCVYMSIYGCKDPTATNYNPTATDGDGSCTYDTSAPISATPVIYNGAYFTPACGQGVVYFDSPNAFAPMNCGSQVSFGLANKTFELRGLDANLNIIPPTIFVTAINNPFSGISIEPNKNRISLYNPTIDILFPKKGTLFSNVGLIDYSARDENDLGGLREKLEYGLGSKPVSLFYSDKISEWYPGIIIEESSKNLIEKGLPAINKYKWSIKDLLPGVLYRIIANVTDNHGDIGEAISEFFSIDITAPVFFITTDQVVVRKGNVEIFVKSSEDLSSIPTVTVTQRGYKPVLIMMDGSNKEFRGTYNVVEGYDGVATIQVNGEDLAGNKSSLVVSGGNISIGVNPPEKPKILFPQDNFVTGTSSINISGNTREDTEVTLKINGVDIKTVKPDSKGNFIFNNIILDKLNNQGLNYISITAKDLVGNISESDNIKIKYNIPPVVSITKPANSAILGNQVVMVSSAKDDNQDILFYTYEFIKADDLRDSNSIWTIIAEKISSNSFVWDSTEVGNGDYFIRVRVFDGNTETISSPVKIVTKNILPFIRFTDGRRTISKDQEVVLTGKAFVPENLNGVFIKNITYSLDNGKNWNKVSFENAEQLSVQPFTIKLFRLAEGTKQILFNITDSRDMIGRTSHLVTVDKIAPSMPNLDDLKYSGSNFFTDNEDNNTRQEGLQINISGSSEPVSNISLVVDGKTFTTKSLPTGDFIFKDISFKHGKNDFKIFATDTAGNTGLARTISIVYNNPPVITFINPKSLRGLSEKAVISWSIKDIDLDSVKNVKISYRKIGGVFKTLIDNAKSTDTYNWGTKALEEGNDYELNISTTDGLSDVSSSVNFSIDRKVPVLESLKVDSYSSDKKYSFTASGDAYDSISGIEYVEYSLESNGKRSDWYKANITNGFLKKQAQYIIKHPIVLKDSFYKVFVRAIDSSGNISTELSSNFSIDRSSPKVGSYFISKGGIQINPSDTSYLSFYSSSTFDFFVSLESDTKEASLFINHKDFDLNKDIRTGLWKTSLTIDSDITSKLFITAEDISGNLTYKKEIGTFSNIEHGSINYLVSDNKYEPVFGARIKVLKMNEDTGVYRELSENSNTFFYKESDSLGQYELILPRGDYKLVLMKLGFKTEEKKIQLNKTELINVSFTMTKVTGIIRWINSVLDLIRY